MEVLRSVGAKGLGALVSHSGVFHPPQKENQMSFLLGFSRSKCVTLYGVFFFGTRSEYRNKKMLRKCHSAVFFP